MKQINSIIFVSLLLMALFSGCVSIPGETQYTDITVSEAKEMIDKGEVFLLDVRTQEEYDEGHIEGSTLIPVQIIEGMLDQIPTDKKILVYCRTGRRSAQASEILVTNGFTEVYNMKGGIVEWTKSGYDVVK